MNLAAIDIGLNVMRLPIVRVISDQLTTAKSIKYLRLPFRLVHDVFADSPISEVLDARFLKLMTTFQLLMDLYESDAYYTEATLAMRETKNGDSIATFL